MGNAYSAGDIKQNKEIIYQPDEINKKIHAPGNSGRLVPVRKAPFSGLIETPKRIKTDPIGPYNISIRIGDLSEIIIYTINSNETNPGKRAESSLEFDFAPAVVVHINANTSTQFFDYAAQAGLCVIPVDKRAGVYTIKSASGPGVISSDIEQLMPYVTFALRTDNKKITEQNGIIYFEQAESKQGLGKRLMQTLSNLRQKDVMITKDHLILCPRMEDNEFERIAYELSRYAPIEAIDLVFGSYIFNTTNARIPEALEMMTGLYRDNSIRNNQHETYNRLRKEKSEILEAILG